MEELARYLQSSDRGPWSLSESPALTHVLSNAYPGPRGLPSLAARPIA